MGTKALNNLLGHSIGIRSSVSFVRDPAKKVDANDGSKTRLQYDFDFIPSNIGRSIVATFRSPETLQALQAADPRAARLMEDCGFVRMSWTSGVPAGHYLPQDAARRVALIESLNLNLSLAAVYKKPIDWGDFDITHLVESIERAKPLQDMALIDQPISLRQKITSAQRQKKRASRRRAIYSIGLCIGSAMVGYTAAKMNGW